MVVLAISLGSTLYSVEAACDTCLNQPDPTLCGAKGLISAQAGGDCLCDSFLKNLACLKEESDPACATTAQTIKSSVCVDLSSTTGLGKFAGEGKCKSLLAELGCSKGNSSPSSSPKPSDSNAPSSPVANDNTQSAAGGVSPGVMVAISIGALAVGQMF